MGTIEYIAIALFTAEKYLRERLFLSDHDISRSWVSFFQMKIRECIPLDSTMNIGYNCKVNIEDGDDGQAVGHFELRVKSNSIKYSITFKPTRKTHSMSGHKAYALFQDDYKKRSLNIEDITLCDLNKCSASLEVRAHYSTSAGIGSYYKGLLITDIIIVTGQLIEALLKNHEKIDNKIHANLWLREFCMNALKPEISDRSDINLIIDDLKVLEKKDCKWKSFHFISELGNTKYHIKAVSQLNN